MGSHWNYVLHHDFWLYGPKGVRLSFGALVHVSTCSIGNHRRCHVHAEMVKRKLPQGLFPFGLLKFCVCINFLGFYLLSLGYVCPAFYFVYNLM